MLASAAQIPHLICMFYRGVPRGDDSAIGGGSILRLESTWMDAGGRITLIRARCPTRITHLTFPERSDRARIISNPQMKGGEQAGRTSSSAIESGRGRFLEIPCRSRGSSVHGAADAGDGVGTGGFGAGACDSELRVGQVASEDDVSARWQVRALTRDVLDVLHPRSRSFTHTHMRHNASSSTPSYFKSSPPSALAGLVFSSRCIIAVYPLARAPPNGWRPPLRGAWARCMAPLAGRCTGTTPTPVAPTSLAVLEHAATWTKRTEKSY
ncbi:hypothetical protein DFH09DRAFT_1320247 [Mycena vulgaris]|nr:hypothetical protein DFH09DRAFT_1320247 [Mycena vulgaris]